MTGSVINKRVDHLRAASVGEKLVSVVRATTISRVQVQLLGRWRLRIDGDDIDRVSDGGMKLVAMLALRGSMSRIQVAGMLWPETYDESAAGRLRTLLWRFPRRASVVIDSQGTLALAAGVDVDVDRMRLAASDLAMGDSRDMDATLFEHDLLPGLYDDWLAVDRERVRQARLHALESLSAARSAQSRFASALDAALSAVRAEPLRESAHRSVIAVHLAEGNVAEAVRQLDACRDLLKTELGVSPSPSLVALLPVAR